MWEKLRVVFTIPELRQKILLTLVLLAIYRVGFQIPLPIVDQAKMTASSATAAAAWPSCCKQVAVFSASQLEPGHDLRPGHHAVHFGLDHLPAPGQRLAAARSDCRRKAKAAARRSTNTRATPRWSSAWSRAGSTSSVPRRPATWSTPAFLDRRRQICRSAGTFVAVLTMTAGTVFLMWLGEQIDEFGIGNGISLLIMAGILAAHARRRHAAARQIVSWSWTAAAASSASKR